jgi:phage terminase large subunit
MSQKTISVYDLIGKGFEKAWNFKGRYRVIKGSRNSKKSVVMMGYRIIMDILENENNNVLVLRQNDRDNRQSTFANIIKWLDIMGVVDSFKITTNVMEIIYKPTGQKIIFRGMNNPTGLTSTTFSKGMLSKIYIEEAFEIKDYEDFRKIDGSLRGTPPLGVHLQITMVFNGWSINTWLYDVFFKGKLEDDYEALMRLPYIDYRDDEFLGDYGRGLYLMINNYKINEWRDKNVYDAAMLELSKRAPDIFKVEALGMWGNSTGACYPEMSDKLVLSRGFINNMDLADYAIGIDTGLSDGQGKIDRDGIRSATSMHLIGIAPAYDKIICINEFFHTNIGQTVPTTEPQMMEKLIDVILEWFDLYKDHPLLFKEGVINVFVDSADIGFRQGLELTARKRGIIDIRFIGSTKFKIQTRVDFIRLLMAWDEFLISEACPNLIREMRNARKGENGIAREDTNDHAINANEYAWAPFMRKVSRWKTFKEH